MSLHRRSSSTAVLAFTAALLTQPATAAAQSPGARGGPTFGIAAGLGGFFAGPFEDPVLAALDVSIAAPIRGDWRTRLLGVLEGSIAGSTATNDMLVCEVLPEGGCRPRLDRASRIGAALGLERGAPTGRTLRVTGGAGVLAARGYDRALALTGGLTGAWAGSRGVAFTTGLSGAFAPNAGGRRLATVALQVGLRIGR